MASCPCTCTHGHVAGRPAVTSALSQRDPHAFQLTTHRPPHQLIIRYKFPLRSVYVYVEPHVPMALRGDSQHLDSCSFDWLMPKMLHMSTSSEPALCAHVPMACGGLTAGRPRRGSRACRRRAGLAWTCRCPCRPGWPRRDLQQHAQGDGSRVSRRWSGSGRSTWQLRVVQRAIGLAPSSPAASLSPRTCSCSMASSTAFVCSVSKYHPPPSAPPPHADGLRRTTEVERCP